MTVQELLNLLNTLPDKQLLVVLSCDEEGNRFSPSSLSYTLGRYYHHEVHDEVDGDTRGTKAIVLWPE